MKKTQRARFLALSALTTRNEAEQAEFVTLSALAVAHPDASKDTDEGTAAAKPTVTVAGLMTKFTALVSQKETLVRENAAFTQRIKDLEGGNVGAATLVTVLVALGLKAADFAGHDAAAIAAKIKAPAATDASAKDTQISTLTGERDAALGTVNALAAALGLTAADFKAATPEALTKLGIKADDAAFAALTAAQKTEHIVQAAFTLVISARTLANMKEIGFNADALPAQTEVASGGTVAELHKQYNDLLATGKPVEAGEFYVKNFKAMYPAT